MRSRCCTHNRAALKLSGRTAGETIPEVCAITAGTSVELILEWVNKVDGQLIISDNIDLNKI
ncbi:hypothetical protein AYY18_17095 [Morganella psychrotolerans]|uniref:Uncharacterized protein n=1 Tax=Morganella psychrotolerans TaxID=368603 RepID=A0A1B8HRW2_9GAMM|nr:hypothetical protein AYY18_17095 [Morganella psychrotolerans]